jgi:hypothetical protein
MSIQLAGVALIVVLVGGYGAYRVIKALGRKEAEYDESRRNADVALAAINPTVAESRLEARALQLRP